MYKKKLEHMPSELETQLRRANFRFTKLLEIEQLKQERKTLERKLRNGAASATNQDQKHNDDFRYGEADLPYISSASLATRESGRHALEAIAKGEHLAVAGEGRLFSKLSALIPELSAGKSLHNFTGNRLSIPQKKAPHS